MAGYNLNALLQGGMDLAKAFGQQSPDDYVGMQTKLGQRDLMVGKARQEQMKFQAMYDAGKAARAMGQDPNLVTLMMAGLDPRQISEYTGQNQEQRFRGAAVDAARAGNWNDANAALMGVANGPIALATVEGQNLINNRLMQGGGGVSTTEQGRAGMAADAARARASDASAASSYATAAKTRSDMNIGQEKFGLEKSGQWNPSGKTPTAGTNGAAGTGVGAGWNARQIAGAAGVQRNLIGYAAALTGKSTDEIKQLSTDQIAKLVADHGGRTAQGALARFTENVPLPFVGDFLSKVGRTGNQAANADIVGYSNGAGAAFAGFENPSGPITDADRTSATLQMPNYLDPPQVQAQKISNFLEMTGYQARPRAVPAGTLNNLANPPRVTNAAEYNALPSGAQYVTPDGSVRRKK